MLQVRILVASGCALLAASASAQSLVTNGDFSDWDDGLPRGWRTEVVLGAKTKGPSATVAKLDGGGVVLAGDQKTKAWQTLFQRFPIRPGKTYRLDCSARLTGFAVDRGQFLSRYVGLVFYDAQGKRLDRSFHDVVASSWAREIVCARAPAGAVEAGVVAFLANTGRLALRDLSVASLAPGSDFELVAELIGRYYSQLALRKVDWAEVVARYRPRAEVATSRAKTVSLLREMLAELEDLQVWLQVPGRGTVPTYTPEIRRNYAFSAVTAELRALRRIGSSCFIGLTREGYGYVMIGSFRDAAKVYEELRVAIEGLFTAPGILVDIRANTGGDEGHAQRIAAMFADRRRDYARVLVRSGARPGDLVEVEAKRILPRVGPTYEKPVVCLIGPSCMSSGESLALMLRCLPQVRLVGQPTRGALGQAQPVSLPCGVDLWFSRVVVLAPDASPVEGRGVPPDLAVRHEGDGDPTYRRGLAELVKLAKRAKASDASGRRKR